MATRSSITVKHSDGNYHSIYCHFDGYLDGVGEMLSKYYASTEMAEALVALGSVSILDKSIECPEGHSYDTKVRDYSVFYHRDRGEDWEETCPRVCSK